MDPQAQLLVDGFAVRLGRDARILVTGSAATDDWRSSSDVDLVIVTDDPIGPADVDELTELHSRSRIDGIYLTGQQLAAGPDGIAYAPQVVDGVFVLERAGDQLTWVTWLELEQAGHGPFFADTASRAGTTSRANLESYWAPLGRQASVRDPARLATEIVPADMVEWVALGPARLVMTIEQGIVASKTEAGLWAQQEWPQHAATLGRVLRYRATSVGEFTMADARAALDLLDACVARGTL